MIIFPYFFPLQLHNVLDEGFHPCGAVLFHGVCDVAVNIQGESGGGVAQVGLYGLDIVPGADRVYRVCVPLWHNKDKSENP